MNWKTIEAIARSVAPGPDKPSSHKQFYLNQQEVAVLIGRTRQFTRAFLEESNVPFYSFGRSEKSYFLCDVIEAIEKTRWKAPNMQKRPLNKRNGEYICKTG